MQDNQENGLQKFLNVASIDHTQLVDAVKFQVTEGNVDPVQAFITLKRMAKIVELTLDSQKGDKELRQIFKDSVAKSLDGGKSVDMFGANLRLQATGTWYDYTTCQDTYLNECVRIRDLLDEAIKTREAELKAILPPDDNKTLGIRSRTIVQEVMPSFEWVACGEDNVVFPAVKNAGESIICTFKKNK